jgi:hypothetical protein
MNQAYMDEYGEELGPGGSVGLFRLPKTYWYAVVIPLIRIGVGVGA